MSLIIPNADEACSIGLAPTTSTSMMLVLGDAICISLMRIKKFTVKNYREIHPAGSLGESLIQVKKIMHSGRKIPQINENDSMKNAILEITRKSFGHVIVTNKSSKIVGIITDGDLRRAVNKNLLDKEVSLIMNRDPFVIKEDLLCTEALSLMSNKKISCLFVENKMKPILSKNMPLPQEYVATQDTFGESGTPTQLMEKYGLNAKSIIEKTKKVISRK